MSGIRRAGAAIHKRDMTAGRPLTDRILGFFRIPTWLGIALWGLLPIPESLGLTYILRQAGAPVSPGDVQATWISIATYIYATVLSLWGTRRLADEVERIRPTLDRLTAGRLSAGASPIRGVGNVAGPLVLTAALTAVDILLTSLEYGLNTALLAAPFGFIFQLPLLTLFWTYVSILLGLNRLGGMQLALDQAPGDRTLGLRPVGNLAFTGFWIFSVALAPVLIITATSTVQLVLNLAFFLLGVGVFLLSLARLHGHLVEARRVHLSLSRSLYAAAYEPIVRKGTLASLRSQSSLLSSAEALERRASMIQEWPFDEVLGGRIAIIVTSVVATVVARIVLGALGF